MTQYYNLGGKPRPIRFGFGAVMIFEKATGKSILAVSSAMENGTLQLTDMVELIYAGYLNGCRSEKITPGHDKNDVCDWLDEMPQEDLEKITLQFANSFAGGKAKPADDDAGEKN